MRHARAIGCGAGRFSCCRGSHRRGLSATGLTDVALFSEGTRGGRCVLPFLSPASEPLSDPLRPDVESRPAGGIDDGVVARRCLGRSCGMQTSVAGSDADRFSLLLPPRSAIGLRARAELGMTDHECLLGKGKNLWNDRHPASVVFAGLAPWLTAPKFDRSMFQTMLAARGPTCCENGDCLHGIGRDSLVSA